MPFQIGWHKEHRIVKLMVLGEVTLAETQNINQALGEYLMGASQTVHILIDISQMTNFPANAQQLKSTMHNFAHRRLGWVVFVDEGTTLNSLLLHLFSQLLGDKFRTFSNLKLSMDFLKLQDPTLAWMSTATAQLQSRFAKGQTREIYRRPA